MEVTLLGTGDATGVPVPLCECEYCASSERRRRPSVLVESDGCRALLDAGPDLPGQLDAVGVQSVDGVFLTHAHGDHSEGLLGLHQGAKWDADHLANVDGLSPTPESFEPEYPVFLTATARERLSERFGRDPGVRMDLREVGTDEVVDVGALSVRAVPVDHHRPTFDTVGFLVDDGVGTVLYAPDMRAFHGDPPAVDVDVLVCEGAAVLGQPVHGPREDLLAAIESVDADRVVLVNVNEHLQRARTDELRDRASELGYEIGVDFQCIEL